MPPSAGPSSQSEVSLIPGHLATLKLPSLAPQTNPSLDVHRGWREHARRRGILLQGACSANWASLVSRKDSPASARAPDQPLLIKAPRREPGGTAGHWAIPASGSPQTAHHQPAQSAITTKQSRALQSPDGGPLGRPGPRQPANRSPRTRSGTRSRRRSRVRESVVHDELVGVQHCPPDVLEGAAQIATAGHQEGRGDLPLLCRCGPRQGRHVERVDLFGR